MIASLVRRELGADLEQTHSPQIDKQQHEDRSDIQDEQPDNRQDGLPRTTTGFNLNFRRDALERACARCVRRGGSSATGRLRGAFGGSENAARGQGIVIREFHATRRGDVVVPAVVIGKQPFGTFDIG